MMDVSRCLTELSFLALSVWCITTPIYTGGVHLITHKYLAPLLDVDWSTVPFEDAKISWEAGIRENDDLPRFTEYMLSVGHRPALRWLLWVVSDVDNSFWLQSSKKFRKEYLQLYHNFIEFQLVDGLTASEYYSIHWKDIIWDTARQKWRHK